METEIENLYYLQGEESLECAKKKESSKTPLIAPKKLEKALRNILSGLDVKNEIEPTFFEETLKILNKAAEEGFGRIEHNTPDNAFLREIKANNAVFAAFKTHRQQNDLAKRLVDAKGELKSFAQFKTDTQSMVGNYNTKWLHTEYNTAVIRARIARQFKQFAREKYMFPNLEWLPSLSAHPREAHKVFYNRVWAQDDPFWSSNIPGSIWGCKCSVKSTDAAVSTGSISKVSMPKASPGLDTNPAKDGKLFSDTHPYVTKSYPGAKKAVEKQIEDYLPYTVAKKYENGGQVRIYKEVDKKASDYKPIYNICNQFAKDGKVCEITPRIHFKNEQYKDVYGSLIGTKYENKCPDFKVDGVCYEFEGYTSPFTKKKISNMISKGLKQSSRVVIDNTKGASDRIIKKSLQNRLRNGQDIEELWVYEKGEVRIIK